MLRKVRHWRQRYVKNGVFVFRRPVRFGPNDYKAGDPIPQELYNDKKKLRFFWDSKTIELYVEDSPRAPHITEQEEHHSPALPDLPAGFSHSVKKPWFRLIGEGGVEILKQNGLENYIRSVNEFFSGQQAA